MKRENHHMPCLQVCQPPVFCHVFQVFIFSRSEVAPGEFECWGHFAEPWGLKAYVTWMTVAVFLLPALIITICQVNTGCTLHKLLTRITHLRQCYSITKHVACMKCCFVFMTSALIITCGRLWLVLCSVPWRIGILWCLPSVLLYLRKDISGVQLFPLINTALGGPLLRRLPTLRTSCQEVECTRSQPNIESLTCFHYWVSNQEALFDREELCFQC